MIKMPRLAAAMFAACLLAAPAMETAQAQEIAQESFFALGTGGVTGVYYPTGGAMCRLVNQNRNDFGQRCFVESTDGSLSNIARLRGDDMQFGIVQSDWQSHAYNGTSRFAGVGPFEALRSVFSVHAEPFTVVVRADSDIATFEDIRGKRVNIGNTGSGVRGTMEVLMGALDMSTSDFADAVEFASVDQPQALCSGQIDVMVYTVGHPAAAIAEVTTRCDVRFISVTGAGVDALMAANGYYRPASIPGDLYRGIAAPTPTFGVGATLVTVAQVEDDVVYALVKSVFDDFDVFTNLHPALAGLSQAQMIGDGLTAPLHPGALRYYRERGWLE